MTIETFLAFLIAATAVIIIPGPTNLIIVSSAISSGLRHALWTIFGAAISHILLCTIATMGLATLLSLSAEVFEVVRWVGAAYMIWLGVTKWRKASRQENLHLATSSSGCRFFFRGFLANSANPKALIFYGVFFPPFLTTEAPLQMQLLILSATFVLIFLIVALLHGLLAAKIGDFFQKPRQRLLLDRISGTILIGAGGILIASGQK